MPNLPTLTLGQAHFDRVVNAFPGETGAEKVASYQAWLVNHLIDFVELQESRAIDEDMNAQKIAQLQAVRDSLPDKVPFPPNFDEPPEE